MILRDLQRHLERIYRLDAGPDIRRFLVSAEELRLWLPEGAGEGPQLLLRESGGELFLAVHPGPEGLEPKTLSDFLAAAEEASHFVYVSFRAQNDRPVSLLDLELQGEIDQYLLASIYFPREPDLLAKVFGRFRWIGRMTGEARGRYEEARRLGERFLRSLGGFFGRLSLEPRVLRELRGFYRLASQGRLARIARP